MKYRHLAILPNMISNRFTAAGPGRLTGVFAAIALLFFISASPAQSQKSRVKAATDPKQAVTAEVEGTRANPADNPVIFGVTVEQYKTDIVVNRDGTSVQTWDITQRAGSARGAESLKKVVRVFHGDLEEMEISDAYIVKANGKKVPVPATAIQKKPTPQSEAAPVFSTLMMIEAAFDGLVAGDTMHYKAVLKTRRTHFDGHFDRMDYLAAAFDWKSAEITLRAPADLPVYIQAVDLDGGKLPDQDGTSNWRWTKKDFKAIELETGLADIFELSPRVMMTTFKDFESLGRAYWKEASKMSVVTPAIKAQADEITKNATSVEEQVYAIYQWVNKNVRYLSLVIDRNGWVPHDASQILANRYGDCKDYSTLIFTLLKAKGIESHPVIIRADMGTWFPSVAVSSFFNHAILYIPTLDLYADATSPNTRLGLIPQQIAGKKAFLAGEKTGLIETHSNRPDDSQIFSKIEVDINPDGGLKAKSVNTYIGRTEIMFRPVFSGKAASNDVFVGTVLAFYGISGTGKITRLGDPFKVREPFEVEMEMSIDNYTTLLPTGSFRVPLALSLNNLMALGDLVKLETRRSNLNFGACRFKETYTFRFPAGVKVDQTSLINASHSNKTGSFKNEFTLEGQTVTVVREVVIARDTVTPDEYPMARELLTKASTAFQTEIRYTAPAAFVRDKSKSIARSPVPAADAWEKLFETEMAKFSPVSAAEARRLEASLLKSPNDADARIKLLLYYSSFDRKKTKSNVADQLRHRLWLIENRPELGDEELQDFRFTDLRADSPELAAIRQAWQKQIATKPDNSKIRINAFESLKREDPTLAVKLIEDGIKTDPNNYELPLALQQFYHGDPYKMVEETVDEKKKRLSNEIRFGQDALSLLKNERSDERDLTRRRLLQSIVKTAYDVGDFDKSASLATELILDFGNDARQLGYDDATHIGNIYLGRVELQKRNVAKAKEYLLIAIRAPLRKSNSWLSEIDLTLAKEMFEASEKEVVIEYLKLCQGLSNLTTEKKLYENQATALRLWQDEIRLGKTPSFDFYNLKKR